MNRQGVFAAAAAGMICLPTWNWYLNRLQDPSDEPYGALALVTALFFAVRGLLMRKSEENGCEASPYITGALIACYLFSRCVFPPIVAAFCAVLLVGQLLTPCCFGRRFLPGFHALLFLSLPLLPTLQFYLGYPLRVAAATLAVQLLAGAGFDVQLSGVLLIGGGKTVLVDAPCSGVKMLWTISYISALGLTAYELTGMRATAAAAVSAALVFLGNALRTAILFVLEVRFVDAGERLHQGVGLVIFVTVALLLSGAVRIMSAERGTAAQRLVGQRGARAHPALWPAIFSAAVALSLIIPVRSFQNAKQGAIHAWPTELDGERLDRLELTAREASFTKKLPGGGCAFSQTGKRRRNNSAGCCRPYASAPPGEPLSQRSRICRSPGSGIPWGRSHRIMRARRTAGGDASGLRAHS